MQATATLRDGKLFIAGRIDEEFDAEQAFLLAQGPKLTIDLSEISGINSVGIMRWVPAIADLTSRLEVDVQRVGYSLVMQANSVLGFFGEANIVSVMAPYFCEGCNANSVVEVSSTELESNDWASPARECASCSQKLDFDELDDFFSFMAKAKS